MGTATKVTLGVAAVVGFLVFWGVTTSDAYEEGWGDCKAGRRKGAAKTQGLRGCNGTKLGRCKR